MACEDMYVAPRYRTREEEEDRYVDEALNRERDVDFETIEAELESGQARIETDPMTGAATIVGNSVMPEGMGDMCVMAGLQNRDSLAWQLAVGQAGVEDQNFAAMHGHSHSH